MGFKLFGRKTAETEETKKGKELTGGQKKHLAAVAKESGWSREEALRAMEAARKRYGISFADYRKKEFWKVPENEQPEKYKKILTTRARNKNRYDEMAMKSGLTVEELKARFHDARDKYGLGILDFKDNDFWGVPEDQQEEKSRQILEAKEERAEARRKENDAAEFRRNLILSDGDQAVSTHKNDNAYPEPVRAACALLGHPLPEDAVKEKRLEEYIGKIGCAFKDLQDMLGETALPDTPGMRKEYRSFKKRFSTYGPLSYTDTDMAVLFTDLLFFGLDYGFNNSDYLEYRFYEKEIAERNTFISQGYRGHVRTVCNTNLGLFKNKPAFNEFFSSVLKRDWLQVTDFNFEEFKAFVARNKVFFYKPIRGGGGVSAGIIDSGERDIDELYAFCSEHECIVEEVLKQHEDMAAFCDSVANTIRAYTLVKADGEIIVTGTFVKFSRPGISADNLMQGGIGALVDKDTGTLITDGVDYNCNHHKEHPDSHLQFKGFKIPNWDKLLDTAIEGAKKAKKWNRHTGWDIAVRSDGEIEVIEGNSWPDLSLLQIADCTGKKYLYRDHIHELAGMYNIPDYPEIPENILPADTDEQCRRIREKIVDSAKAL